MKILIVSSRPTHPTNAGNRKGILNQVEILKRMGHEVSFLYVEEKGLSQMIKRVKNDSSELRNYWGANYYELSISFIEHIYRMLLRRIRIIFNNGYAKVDDYYPCRLTSFVRKIHKNHRFDACIVNYYFLSKLFETNHFHHEALFTHDYYAYKGLLMHNKKVGYNTTAHQEAIAMQRSKNIFAVNREEAIYFQKLSPFSHIYNIFSYYNYYASEYSGNKNILFLSGDNEYNLNGLKWFLDEIFPTLLDSINDIKLYIAGGICRKLSDINHPNIIILGFIQNPEDFYSLGDFVINPIFEGTGLKIKTFEGVSYDKVVLAHPHSAEGIYKPGEAPIFVSSNKNEWCDFLKSTMMNKEKIEFIKIRDREYIDDMNRFIESEYKRFLSNDNN